MDDNRSRLPPGQQLAAPGKWPVIGERAAREDHSPWRVRVTGLVERPLDLSLADLRALPYRRQQVDIHCVTRWSKFDAQFGGVLLSGVLQLAGVMPEARFISFMARSSRSHSTSLALADVIALEALLALDYEGAPLAADHGGPVRVITPGRYFYKSLKWLEQIELLAVDKLGYWEREAGYHNSADPWREERYIANQLDRHRIETILQKRDFSGLDLLSLDVRQHDLTGLAARGAILRNANFSQCHLRDASFERANLSNAHFAGADLQGASFRDADVEGADFSGADLRGADFRRASLVGVTFLREASAVQPPAAARLDSTTQFDPPSLNELTPSQAAFVERHCRPVPA